MSQLFIELKDSRVFLLCMFVKYFLEHHNDTSKFGYKAYQY